MDVKNIYRRSIRFVIFGVATIAVLKTIPLAKLSNNEVLMIVAYISVIYGIVDTFAEKLQALV